jgi:hypothetical protein
MAGFGGELVGSRLNWWEVLADCILTILGIPKFETMETVEMARVFVAKANSGNATRIKGPTGAAALAPHIRF